MFFYPLLIDSDIISYKLVVLVILIFENIINRL